MAVLVSGCASPGRPLPPSLRLPTPVQDLRAERVGNTVELHWITPAEATDGVALKGAVTTELCRDPAAVGARDRCTVVKRWSVPQGPSEVTDTLPSSLTVDPTGELVFHVRLLNAAAQSAGLSNGAAAASGQAPPAVQDLQVTSDAAGVRLTWATVPGPPAVVELLRKEPGVPEASQHAATRPAGLAGLRRKKAAGQPRKSGISKSHVAEPGVRRLVVEDTGARGAAGAIDPTVERDRSYSYRAIRVRVVRVLGQELRLRSEQSPAVEVTVRDLLPPTAPRGLVAATDGLAVDLSWEPNFETDLAGYRVYRAEAEKEPTTLPPNQPWVLRTPQPTSAPAFRDVVAHPGTFFYRVMAVDEAGNESESAGLLRVMVSPAQQR